LTRWRAPLLLALVLGGVYLGTLLPGVGHNGDTAEMQFCGLVLGIPHPTGYPGYLALNHLMALVPVASPAWRANLLSAVFAVPACTYLLLLLRELGVREGLALASALAFGLTPTFWRHAVIAEVYSLQLLFLAAVTHHFLRWTLKGRERDFALGTALYALSFGNHLAMITLLPALVWLVARHAPRSFVTPRQVAWAALWIGLGALQYAYLFWRSADHRTPYLAAQIVDLGSFWAYVSGAQFHGSMFAFGPRELLAERLPLFAGLAWGELGPLLALALLGALQRRSAARDGFLWLAVLGTLGFALGYDIPDVFVYFLPSYFVMAIWIGRGLETLARRWPRPVTALAALMPAALFAFHLGPVLESRRPEAATRARQLLERAEPGSLLIAGYHEYQFLLYLTLAERQGPQPLFVGHQIEPEALRDYLLRDRPLLLERQRRQVPPGLAVYSTKLNHKARLEALGLVTEPFFQGAYRVRRPAPRPEG
jgi:hypothetical protein